MRVKFVSGIIATICMFFMILDSNFVLQKAQEAIMLCLRTVIPSLFPFFFLSGILLHSFTGIKSKFFDKLCSLIGIPTGCTALLFAGFLGGYPTGALTIAKYYEEGAINKKTAHRLLGFCSNAGPSFIFGMIGNFFSNAWVPWFLWLIHVLSAVITGLILPGATQQRVTDNPDVKISLYNILQTSMRAVASVCGWVVLFRILTGIFTCYFLTNISDIVQCILCGILELTNGCLSLSLIASEWIRFILCAMMLSFGGICIILQTYSVTTQTGLGMYLPGKALQTWISFLLSLPAIVFLYPGQMKLDTILCLLALPIFVTCPPMIKSFLKKKGQSVLSQGTCKQQRNELYCK